MLFVFVYMLLLPAYPISFDFAGLILEENLKSFVTIIWIPAELKKIRITGR